MSSTSPSVVLYSSTGVESTVATGVVIPAGTEGYLGMGTNGTDGYFIQTDNSGNQIVVGLGIAGTPAGGVVSVQGVAGGTPVTVSGTVTVSNLSVGATGAAPPADATYVGALVTTAMESGLTSGDMYPFSLTTTGLLRIDGSYPLATVVATAVDMAQVGGIVTTASPTYTTATINALSLTTAGALRVDGSAVTQPVSGTVAVSSVAGTVAVTQSTSPWVVSASGNFNNASVGVTAAAPPADATYMGALVTTAAESGLTTGDMYPLNLTTTGQLRLDGVYPLATAVATAVSMDQVGGVVTTAAPTYTTGTVNGLSLDTSGNLRVTGSFNNSSVSNVAAAPPAEATYVGALVTTAAESGLTSGDMYPFNLTTTGQLRIDGAYPLATAVATAVDMNQVGGVVTTAAPAYTTATTNALSLTTVGGLRVDGTYPAGTANASAPDVGNSGGYVTTAAPTYTTGQLEPLSLDTSGNLRVTAITNKASTATVTLVAVTASTATSLLASNTNRLGASLYNNTNKTVYVLLGAGTASATNFTLSLLTNSYWEVPVDFSGAISEFAPSGASGNINVTELTF